MIDICLITTCMGRLSHLKETLPRMIAQPGCRVVVVDYSCPDRCGEWVESEYPEAAVVRIEDQLEFNPSRARNAGAQAANTEWLFFLDADIILDRSFSEAVFTDIRKGSFHVSEISLKNKAFNTLICSLEDFERVNGYDEIYRGWGDEDVDLVETLQWAGVTLKTFPTALITHISHEGAAYFAHDRRFSFITNRIFRTIKFDIMKLQGRFLPFDMRKAIYQGAENMVKTACEDPKRADLQLEIGHSRVRLLSGNKVEEKPVPVEWKITKTLVYSLSAMMPGPATTGAVYDPGA